MSAVLSVLATSSNNNSKKLYLGNLVILQNNFCVEEESTMKLGLALSALVESTADQMIVT